MSPRLLIIPLFVVLASALSQADGGPRNPARKEAWVKCSQAAGFTPGQGQRPTAEQKTAIGQCMTASGWAPHPHGQRNEQTPPSPPPQD